MPPRYSLIPLTLAVLLSCVNVHAEEKIDFNRDIRPILSSKCFACHGPDEEKRGGDLRLDNEYGSRADLGGYAAITPGDSDGSELIYRVTADDDDDIMPPPDKGAPLSEAEVATLKRWINQGGDYAVHWSYEKPVRPTPPKLAHNWLTYNPIDSFIQSRLVDEGLTPSPQADRLTLARRVSLDLIGLPPTWDEAMAFANDPRADAYEYYVDGLLAKPSYGERWATVWLDLARYADSAGYADDPTRTIWSYRDWVIQAFNRNQRFDQFTIDQIAGDLVDNPSVDQLIATAFHRNTPTNNEGGTNDEEFRNVAVADRVNTTFEVWMGTTMACAQCHTHKFDPITHTEYFQIFDYFNQSADTDKKNEAPTHEIWTKSQLAKKEQLTAQMLNITKAIRSDTQISEAEKTAQQDQLTKLSKQLAATKPLTVPIMQDLAATYERATFIQIRGNYKNTGEQVKRNTPAAFHPLQADLPNNRLALAQWLIDAENPLTSRVIVNRFWEQIFGVGIVQTSEEFGSQGEPPTHPQLLDWLAVELQENGWDMKALLKLMVTSATYRQVSNVTDQLKEKDPFNRYYARAPRFRVSAEMIRDQALFVSGLLSDKMYGKPVNPPQPDLGLKAAFGSKTDWVTSKGEDKFRRGIYTSWRRSSPYASMATFDAPNREICISRRIRTNTPLQALVTLNDPVYVEAAQALARRAIKHGGDTTKERIDYAWRLALIREPSKEELKRLTNLFMDAKTDFALNPSDARTLASNPIGPIPNGGDAAELAALTVVGNVILNLDELFLKR